jgi:signal transduction histidine kinase
MQQDGLMDVTGGLIEPALRRLDALRRVVLRPIIGDIVLVSLVILFALAQDYFDPGAQHRPWAWAFDLALTLPLLWRRRRAAEVFALIAAIALLQWLTGTMAGGDLAVLVALYALGGYEPRRRVIAAGVLIAQIGVLLAVLRWAPAEHQFTSGILLTGTVTAAWVLGVYSRTRRAYVSSVLERAATAERELDQQARFAVASERARISREMHDIVAHSLSVMIALSDGAAAAVTRDPQAARTTMGQASAVGRQALGEVRRLLGTEQAEPTGDPSGQPGGGVDLSPQPGIAELDDLVAQVRSAGLAVDLIVAGRQPRLAPGAQLAVYRMVQEALTNVLKHARSATQATVTLRYRNGGIDIEVENDDDPPRGAAPSAGPGAGSGAGAGVSMGRGLAGMRERAAVFGGTVESGRRADGGWRVASHLVLQEDTAR